MSDWDSAASEYEANWESTTGQTVAHLVEWLQPADGLTFVDAAAGPGTVTMRLAERGAQVIASDFSPAMVARLRARARELGVSARVDAQEANAESLPYGDDVADGAVSNFGIIFAPAVDRAIGELARVTRPGGRLAMTAWSVEGRNGWTTLLGDDHEAVLGFSLGPRPAYRWGGVDEFLAALDAAGWRGVQVETIAFPLTVFASADEVVHAIESPATKIALAHLDPGRVDALRRYLVAQARAKFGDGEVTLPREAWLARATA